MDEVFGTYGIGRATAARLADAGHLVVAAARRADALTALASPHPGVRLLPCSGGGIGTKVELAGRP